MFYNNVFYISNVKVDTELRKRIKNPTCPRRLSDNFMSCTTLDQFLDQNLMFIIHPIYNNHKCLHVFF